MEQICSHQVFGTVLRLGLVLAFPYNVIEVVSHVYRMESIWDVAFPQNSMLNL